MFAGTNPLATGHETRKDTASAVVMYGDSLLIERPSFFPNRDYNVELDSLLMAEDFDAERVAQLRLIQTAGSLTNAQVTSLIDSLFTLSEVPYPLINELNLYITMLENQRARYSIFAAEVPHGSPHPAQQLYGNWNEEVPHPYKLNHTNPDTGF